MNVDVIILAAGQGTRMRSALPKVLHPIAGKAMLAHVIDAARQLPNSKLNIVIGHGADQVKALDNGDDIQFAMQSEQLGTGHAVQQALPSLREDSVSIILYGDVPLISVATLETLLDCTKDGQLGLLTAIFDDPTGYGRIIRNESGEVIANVEQKDASDEQLKVQEINTGFMAVPTKHLIEWLPKLSNSNAQNEYYLTDLIEMAASSGVGVKAVHPGSRAEVEGVNSRQQLIALERLFQRQQADHLLVDGVSILDPQRFDLRGSMTCGTDSSIDVNCVFEGNVEIGSNVVIGPNCVISDTTIGDGVEIKANSVLENASVEDNCVVGPFARLRPGSVMRPGSKVGNFVEMKKSELGSGSKINHLSYVGDTTIGSNSNIGAGTITCNYDGVNKFKTTMGDDVFVGSNSTLVAPLDIESGGFVGAGSTITRTIKSDQLAVGRGKQRNIDGWKRPTKDK
ncbi:MAG: bifunctional UDP-N-acetylglucosamine diphosphorylase/glucosamine-1-phosphate N-acetyltransferase GlmU [Pseudomonadales bacterium]